MSNAGSQDNLNAAIVRAIPVVLPPISEQRAISDALSHADALIAVLDALIAKNRAMKQGAMQQLLTGKMRLQASANASYHDTEAGRIPSDWKAVQLGDLFTFKNGLNKGKEYFGAGTPIINYMDVYQNHGIRAGAIQGSVTLAPDEIDKFRVRKGDVFFTRTSETSAEVGMAAVLLDDSPNTVFSGFVLRARPLDTTLDDRFKQYCFRQDTVRKQIVSTSTETTRALTNGRLLGNVWIARPSLAEQSAIAEVLDDMGTYIAALEARREKTKSIKQGMMQALLTGRVRLAVSAGKATA